MASQDLNDHMGRLRERWRDPLLTIVTILILFMLFVAPPLEAINLHLIHEFAFVVTLAVIVRIFVMSGNLIAVIAMLIAISMAGASIVLRLKGPSIVDIYLLAGTWLIMGITLGWVVAREVFASGNISYNRIMGAILLYLVAGMTCVALFLLVGMAFPKSFSG